MFDCRYCKFQRNEGIQFRIPLYRMCCEANMIDRCVHIVNFPYLSEHSGDIEWLNKNEEDRKAMTVYQPLAKKAYHCYNNMNRFLRECEEMRWGHRNTSYTITKVANKRWQQRNAQTQTIYMNIQLLHLSFDMRRLNINTIDNLNVGEECYREFIVEKRRITSGRNQVRNVERHRQMTNDYAYLQRRGAAEILYDLRNPSIERSLFDEFDAAAKEDLVTKEKAIETSDCSICFEELGETNKMILRCGHQFCGDCIFRHHQCQNGSSCPSCRAQFI